MYIKSFCAVEPSGTNEDESAARRRQLTEQLASPHPMEWGDLRLPEGLIIELGVGSGGSFNYICHRFWWCLCYGFDWFHGLPESWNGNGPGAFSTDGIPPDVPANGRIVVGKIEDTLYDFLMAQRQRIAFVHFDMDLYTPTRYALSIMNCWFQAGTVLVFDEIRMLAAAKDHEEKAVREWLEGTQFRLEHLGTDNSFGAGFKLIT